MKPKSSTSDQVQGPLGPSSWQVVPCCSLSLTSQHLWVPCSPGFPFRFWEVLIISLSPRASCLPILLSTITIFLFNWQTGLSLTFFSLTTPTPAPRMRWRRRPSPLLWSFFFFFESLTGVGTSGASVDAQTVFPHWFLILLDTVKQQSKLDYNGTMWEVY